ncbi:hypothetical protein ACFXKD_27900 [Nocardiopsis aegyptia]|uniref:hypothetical protein n=1 Tax=Nocardiopsis aegyptia TaxID=220378 RepID=UPI0036700F56
MSNDVYVNSVVKCPECKRFRNPDGPCGGCAAIAARAAEVDPRCKDCGTAVGDTATRCGPCGEQRRERERVERDQVRAQILDPAVRAVILAGVGGGASLPEVCEGLGITVQRVWSAAHKLPGWARALNDALMRGRPEHLPGGAPHGSPRGYKAGCRCPECRTAKREAGHWRR